MGGGSGDDGAGRAAKGGARGSDGEVRGLDGEARGSDGEARGLDGEVRGLDGKARDLDGKVRVLLADDHAILREGLTSLIEKQPGIRVVGEAEDGESCLEKAAALAPDVVVLDIKLPGISGIEVCRRLKSAHPLIKVIMLSMYEEYEYVNQALQAGADGYLLKKVVSSELVNAILKAGQGEKVFSPQILEMIISSFREEARPAKPPSPLGTMTAREREVLSLMSEGLSNKEIALRLRISPKTVEKVLTGIYRKLGVSSRTAAVKFFLSGG